MQGPGLDDRDSTHSTHSTPPMACMQKATRLQDMSARLSMFCSCFGAKPAAKLYTAE